MSECRQGLTLTQNMIWCLLLCFASPIQGTVCKSHYVEMSSQGMSGNNANKYPGLRPIKGQQHDRGRTDTDCRAKGVICPRICFTVCETPKKSSYGKRNYMKNTKRLGRVGSALCVGFVMNEVTLGDVCLWILWFYPCLCHSTNVSCSDSIHLSPTLCNLSNWQCR
jgi:hypothetical protein